MYQGQTKFLRGRVLVHRRTGKLSGLGDSAPKMDPSRTGDPNDDLEEVPLSAMVQAMSKAPYPPDEYGIQEIVVSGTRIPWWMWGIGGVMAFAVLNSLIRGR